MLERLAPGRVDPQQLTDFRPHRFPSGAVHARPERGNRIPFLPCRLLLDLPEGAELQIRLSGNDAFPAGRSGNIYWGTLPAAPPGHRRRMTLGEAEPGRALSTHEMELDWTSALMLDVPAGEAVGFDVVTEGGERLTGHSSEVHACSADCSLVVSVTSRSRLAAFGRSE